MNITVTFTGTGNPHLPDGSRLIFEDVEQCSPGTSSDIADISCEDDGCPGCSAAHHRFTGTYRLSLTATGFRPARWDIPEVPALPDSLYLIDNGDASLPSGLEVLKVPAEGGDA